MQEITSPVNLGQVQALFVSTSEPANKKMVWFDENIRIHKVYDFSINQWVSLKSAFDKMQYFATLQANIPYSLVLLQIPFFIQVFEDNAGGFLTLDNSTLVVIDENIITLRSDITKNVLIRVS